MANPSGAPPEPPANPEIFVRRLYKPRLLDQVTISAGGLSSSSSRRASPPPPPSGLPAPSQVCQSSFLLQSAMALPSEFGKIYLGETFSAYVSIVNTLPAPLFILDAQASLKSSRGAEMLLNNVGPSRQQGEGAQVLGLGITRDRPRELRPGANLDVVVEQVLQELDWHYLAIKLEFVDGRSHETRPMMKRFKFKVYNPLSITATNRLLPNGQVLVQASVKNITERHASLLLEDVTLMPEDGLHSTKVEGAGDGEAPLAPSQPPPTVSPTKHSTGGVEVLDCLAAYDRHVYLQPDDVAQALFLLRRNDTYKGRTMPVAAGTSLGQLRVSWRTTLGEPGMLLSPRITCNADTSATLRPVELVVEEGSLPGELVQGQVYSVKALLANNTDRDLKLQVQFHLELMQGVYISGRAYQNAGLVPAHTRKPFTFQLLPLMAGLHEVKGLIIMDMVTSQEYEQGRLCEVLVVRKPPLAATATPSN